MIASSNGLVGVKSYSAFARGSGESGACTNEDALGTASTDGRTTCAASVYVALSSSSVTCDTSECRAGATYCAIRCVRASRRRRVHRSSLQRSMHISHAACVRQKKIDVCSESKATHLHFTLRVHRYATQLARLALLAQSPYRCLPSPWLSVRRVGDGDGDIPCNMRTVWEWRKTYS